MTRRRSTSPRRASAQISVGRRHGPRQPLGRLRTIDETADILSVSTRTVRRLHRFRRATRASLWSIGARFGPRHCAFAGGKSR